MPEVAPVPAKLSAVTLKQDAFKLIGDVSGYFSSHDAMDPGLNSYVRRTAAKHGVPVEDRPSMSKLHTALEMLQSKPVGSVPVEQAIVVSPPDSDPLQTFALRDTDSFMEMVALRNGQVDTIPQAEQHLKETMRAETPKMAKMVFEFYKGLTKEGYAGVTEYLQKNGFSLEEIKKNIASMRPIKEQLRPGVASAAELLRSPMEPLPGVLVEGQIARKLTEVDTGNPSHGETLIVPLRNTGADGKERFDVHVMTIVDRNAKPSIRVHEFGHGKFVEIATRRKLIGLVNAGTKSEEAYACLAGGPNAQDALFYASMAEDSLKWWSAFDAVISQHGGIEHVTPHMLEKVFVDRIAEKPTTESMSGLRPIFGSGLSFLGPEAMVYGAGVMTALQHYADAPHGDPEALFQFIMSKTYPQYLKMSDMNTTPTKDQVFIGIGKPPMSKPRFVPAVENMVTSSIQNAARRVNRTGADSHDTVNSESVRTALDRLRKRSQSS
jgi:hypothetical protein